MEELDRLAPQGSRKRRGNAGRPVALMVAAAAVAMAGEASAQDGFSYAGGAVHAACVQALVMHEGDPVPVTTAVSLEGCAASARSKSEMRRDGGLLVIQDDSLPGGGSFGYQVISRLENGIFGLAIRRILPDGEERVSLAAVQMVPRSMMRNATIRNVMMLELLGEMWVPDIELASFRSMGNKVHFVSGVGKDRVERNVDFTRLGKLRK